MSPETIESISHVIVKAGHELAPEAAAVQRADSTVVDTNIHYPTESSLIYDGCRKITELCVRLYEEYDITGWRQHADLLNEVKKCNREISRIVAKKGGNYKERLVTKYGQLLRRARSIIDRAKNTRSTLEADFNLDPWANGIIEQIRVFIDRTEQLCLPKPGAKQSVEQNENATPEFRKMQRRHSGIESAIGALQAGNGLDRCRDSTERGFKRYVALAVLGRNLRTLGRLLIAASHPDSAAAYSERQAA